MHHDAKYLVEKIHLVLHPCVTGEAHASGRPGGPQTLAPAGLMTPRAHHPHGVATEEWVFVAGETATGPDGQVVGVDDITAQTTQTIADIATVLAEVGLSLADVVSTTVHDVHLAGISMGGLVAQHFAVRCPSRVRSLAPITTYASCDEWSRRVFDARIEPIRRLGLADRSAAGEARSGVQQPSA